MDQLKVKVGDLSPEGMEIALEVPVARAEARLNEIEGERIRLADPLAIRLRLAPTGPRVIARGRVETGLRAVCARCLEAFDLAVAADIFVTYAPAAQDRTEEEDEAEALNQELYFGEEIDLWPIVEEQLVLSLPIKPLCRQDCLGLCPVCGRNRNQEPCQCSQQAGHPGLAGLKEIKDKLSRR